MRRGGQHGVINWICSQIRPSIHFNDCSLSDGRLVSMAPYKYIENERKRIQIQPSETIDPDDFTIWLFNFEDQWVKETLKMFLDWSKYVFDFESVTSIVLVRDPYNLFASRRKDERIKLLGDEAKALYKSHMDIVMKSSDFVDINFNKWFKKERYRRDLAVRLNIPFTDDGLNDIVWPGESTFDGAEYDGKAQEMKILTRWKQLGDDFVDKEINDELRHYAKQYFDIG
jgi:hypothetical protein